MGPLLNTFFKGGIYGIVFLCNACIVFNSCYVDIAIPIGQWHFNWILTIKSMEKKHFKGMDPYAETIQIYDVMGRSPKHALIYS